MLLVHGLFAFLDEDPHLVQFPLILLHIAQYDARLLGTVLGFVLIQIDHVRRLHIDVMNALTPVFVRLEPSREIRQLGGRHLCSDCSGNDQHMVLNGRAVRHHFAVRVNEIRLPGRHHAQKGYSLLKADDHFVTRRHVALGMAHHWMMSHRALYSAQRDMILCPSNGIDILRLQQAVQFIGREIHALTAIPKLITDRTARFGDRRGDTSPHHGSNQQDSYHADSDTFPYYLSGCTHCLSALVICGTRRSMSPAPTVSTATG